MRTKLPVVSHLRSKGFTIDIENTKLVKETEKALIIPPTEENKKCFKDGVFVLDNYDLSTVAYIKCGNSKGDIVQGYIHDRKTGLYFKSTSGWVTFVMRIEDNNISQKTAYSGPEKCSFVMKDNVVIPFQDLRFGIHNFGGSRKLDEGNDLSRVMKTSKKVHPKKEEKEEEEEEEDNIVSKKVDEEEEENEQKDIDHDHYAAGEYENVSEIMVTPTKSYTYVGFGESDPNYSKMIESIKDDYFQGSLTMQCPKCGDCIHRLKSNYHVSHIVNRRKVKCDKRANTFLQCASCNLKDKKIRNELDMIHEKDSLMAGLKIHNILTINYRAVHGKEPTSEELLKFLFQWFVSVELGGECPEGGVVKIEVIEEVKTHMKFLLQQKNIAMQNAISLKRKRDEEEYEENMRNIKREFDLIK